VAVLGRVAGLGPMAGQLIFFPGAPTRSIPLASIATPRRRSALFQRAPTSSSRGREWLAGRGLLDRRHRPLITLGRSLQSLRPEARTTIPEVDRWLEAVGLAGPATEGAAYGHCEKSQPRRHRSRLRRGRKREAGGNSPS